MSSVAQEQSLFAWPLTRGVAQLTAALVLLAVVPTNAGKLLALLALFALTFDRLRRDEVILFVGGSLLFAAMNVPALANGVFRFASPDVLGMPVWELTMWGFYLLNVQRALRGALPSRVDPAILALAVATALTFSMVRDAMLLTLVAGSILGLGLLRCHTRGDLAYVAYAVLLGAAVEYTGVYAGLWSYPGAPPGGVPLWFVALFGSVGLYLHRLVRPLLATRPCAS